MGKTCRRVPARLRWRSWGKPLPPSVGRPTSVRATRGTLVLLLTLPIWLVPDPEAAQAALRSTLECEYVGSRENLPGRGGGDERSPRPTRSRFAGATRWTTEGPPAGSGGFDDPGTTVSRLGLATATGCSCSSTGAPDPFSPGGSLGEAFEAAGTLEVPGERSVHGRSLQQNVPSCPETGAAGLPARFRWTFGVSRPVLSDPVFQVCLDVRRCAEEDDALGPGASVAMRDFSDAFGVERPVAMRVIHHRGTLWAGASPGPSRCACEDETLEWLQQPTLRRVALPPPWQPLPDPDQAGEIDYSVAFVGSHCLTITVDNASRRIVARDFLTLELLVPASTRVRVRAAADAANVCYVGAILDGERD